MPFRTQESLHLRQRPLPNTFPYPGATPSISANGSTNGIVWAAENAGIRGLHAYDATDLHELYNSNMAANSRDHFGAGNKFIVPTIANGKVYVGTTNGVGVFGLLAATAHDRHEPAEPRKARGCQYGVRYGVAGAW